MAAAAPVMISYTTLYNSDKDLYEEIIRALKQNVPIQSWQKQCIEFGIDYLFKIIAVRRDNIPGIITEKETPGLISQLLILLQDNTVTKDKIKTHIEKIGRQLSKYSLNHDPPLVINFELDTILRLVNICMESKEDMKEYETASLLHKKLINKESEPSYTTVPEHEASKGFGLYNMGSTAVSTVGLGFSFLKELWSGNQKKPPLYTPEQILFQPDSDFETVPLRNDPRIKQIENIMNEEQKITQYIDKMKKLVNEHYHTQKERDEKIKCFEEAIKTSIKHVGLEDFTTLEQLRHYLTRSAGILSQEQRGIRKTIKINTTCGTRKKKHNPRKKSKKHRNRK